MGVPLDWVGWVGFLLGWVGLGWVGLGCAGLAATHALCEQAQRPIMIASRAAIHTSAATWFDNLKSELSFGFPEPGVEQSQSRHGASR